MENLFLVCLVPPLSIVEDVDEIRTYIADQFKVYESLKRPVHITLYNPVKLVSKPQETMFFEALENAAYRKSFTQVVKNFNSFPQHTFYIDVVQNNELMDLQKQIKTALKPLKLLKEPDGFKFTPHVTLAFKDVKPPVFDLILAEFKDRKFKREFLVDGFSVFKHIDKKWQPFKQIKFKDPAQKPQPLSLFTD